MTQALDSIPPFHLQGSVAVNGRAMTDWWGNDVLLGKWTILAIFPSSHTPT